MVQAVQTFAQEIGGRTAKILFDSLPINEGLYILTHAAIALPESASGVFQVEFTVNANLQGSGTVGGNLTAYVVHADSSGTAVDVVESFAYGHIDNVSPNCTLHNSLQMQLNAGDALKVFVVYSGTGTASTIPGQSILSLHQL